MTQNQPPAPESAGFPVLVAEPNLKFRELRIQDPVPTGRQIVEAFGCHSPDDCVIVCWMADGNISEFGLAQTLELPEHETPRFIIAKSDRLFVFVIDDKQGVWPERTITRDALLAIANQNPEQFAVWQELKKQPDVEIIDGHPANLALDGTERFYTVMSKTTEGER